MVEDSSYLRKVTYQLSFLTLRRLEGHSKKTNTPKQVIVEQAIDYFIDVMDAREREREVKNASVE